MQKRGFLKPISRLLYYYKKAQLSMKIEDIEAQTLMDLPGTPHCPA
jgi:hypothetical protein